MYARISIGNRRPARAGKQPMKCSLCEDCGWVCETHPQFDKKGWRH
jgi:hypothetical protein